MIQGGQIYQESPYFSQIDDIKYLKKSTGELKVSPGNISYTRAIGNVYSKISKLGGLPGVISCEPDIVSFKI